MTEAEIAVRAKEVAYSLGITMTIHDGRIEAGWKATVGDRLFEAGPKAVPNSEGQGTPGSAVQAVP